MRAYDPDKLLEGGRARVVAHGQELFYRPGDNVVSVEVRTTRGLVLSARRNSPDMALRR